VSIINNRSNLFGGRTQQGKQRRGGTHGKGARGMNSGNGSVSAFGCAVHSDCPQGKCIFGHCSFMADRQLTNGLHGDYGCPPGCNNIGCIGC